MPLTARGVGTEGASTLFGSCSRRSRNLSSEPEQAWSRCDVAGCYDSRVRKSGAVALVALGVALWMAFLPRGTGYSGESKGLCGRAFVPESLEYLQDIDDHLPPGRRPYVAERCTAELDRGRVQTFVALGVAAVATFFYFVPDPYRKPNDRD